MGIMAEIGVFSSQPPREAVSWNCQMGWWYSQKGVSLLVRLWVEMLELLINGRCPLSASSWGCELKYCFLPSSIHLSMSASSWGCELKCILVKLRVFCSAVSLLVRLWVEMYIVGTITLVMMSASSWGCELKCSEERNYRRLHGQPPREAVSWNARGSESPFEVRLLVRLPIQILL